MALFYEAKWSLFQQVEAMTEINDGAEGKWFGDLWATLAGILACRLAHSSARVWLPSQK